MLLEELFKRTFREFPRKQKICEVQNGSANLSKYLMYYHMEARTEFSYYKGQICSKHRLSKTKEMDSSDGLSKDSELCQNGIVQLCGSSKVPVPGRFPAEAKLPPDKNGKSEEESRSPAVDVGEPVQPPNIPSNYKVLSYIHAIPPYAKGRRDIPRQQQNTQRSLMTLLQWRKLNLTTTQSAQIEAKWPL